jgi:hypothetical protein
VIAARPQPSASTERERRCADALAAAERANTTVTLDQLRQSWSASWPSPSPRAWRSARWEEQAARRVLALAERCLAELRAGATDSLGARVRLVGRRSGRANDEICKAAAERRPLLTHCRRW